MRGVVLSRVAERDLRRIGAGVDLARLRTPLEALAGGAANLDAKPLAGFTPWHRLRVGDYRILYCAVDLGEAADADVRWLAARVVHRRDLERAISTLA
jgi:mRNA-degrading endonuclease RelE of RelBE toxin-antitoxin system